MKDDIKTSIIKCPKCGHETQIEVPQTSCLPAYKCEGCGEIITISPESENCCVVCEFSDDECPIPNKHKK